MEVVADIRYLRVPVMEHIPVTADAGPAYQMIEWDPKGYLW